jgi:hypothetical protein
MACKRQRPVPKVLYKLWWWMDMQSVASRREAGQLLVGRRVALVGELVSVDVVADLVAVAPRPPPLAVPAESLHAALASC